MALDSTGFLAGELNQADGMDLFFTSKVTFDSLAGMGGKARLLEGPPSLATKAGGGLLQGSSSSAPGMIWDGQAGECYRGRETRKVQSKHPWASGIRHEMMGVSPTR